MSRIRSYARHLPWVLLLGALVLLAASVSRDRARGAEVDLELSHLETEVRRLDSESITLRRELGRVRLDMAARKRPARPNGS